MIEYVTPRNGARRLMPPAQRDALASNPDHHADRTVSVEEHRYVAGDHTHLEGLLEEDGASVVIAYTRFWSTPRWRFVVEARATDGRILAQTKNEVYGRRGDHGARFDLEDQLREDKIIK
ncbi:MAG TPA: hypothetical protein VN458_00190 [Solirubrobacterales bacterium]|nr:hypothetical protein [Solirubrobacterales bacterium]